MLTEKFQAPETAQQIAGSNWAPLGSYTWSSAALTSLLFRPHPSESEPENHEQHWFWIGLNRRDPREGHSWRWSDGLGFSYHNFARSQHDDDDIRGCAVLDLASLQWVAMQCQTQLDWICKIPRGWMW